MLFGKNVNHYYLKYWHLFLLGIIALLVVDYIQLLMPENYSSLIDMINEKTLTMDKLMKIVYNMLLITVGMFIGRFGWRVTVLNIGVNVETDLRQKMFNHMEMLSQDYFQIHKTGAQMALYTNDIMVVKNCFSDGVIMIVDAFFLGTLAIIKMLRLNITLTIISSIPLFAMAFFGKIIGEKIDKKFTERQDAFEKISDFSQENFSGISVIKAYVKEDLEYKEFTNISKDFSKKNISFAKFSVSLNVFFSTLISSIVVICLAYGSHLVISTKGTEAPFTAGKLIEFISYFSSLIWPAMALGNLISIVSQGKASLKRINELLEYEVMVKDSENVINDHEFSDSIEFKNLTFRYPGSSVDSLTNVSFKIKKGEKVGIIGKTGCGKTTLVDLITRVYNVPEDSLLIDGIDIMNLAIKDVRNAVAYVPQDNFLFNETVLNNIAFSKDKLELGDAIKYAQAACVHSNIVEFPEGYDTIIGERGVTLSGGQKQRISMARAMAKDAPILILDDSVSAVDTKTEADILKTLKEEFSDKTIIMIAHRVSTIDSLDKIILMDDGRIVATGTHEELYENVEMYKDIVDLQKLEEGGEQ